MNQFTNVLPVLVPYYESSQNSDILFAFLLNLIVIIINKTTDIVIIAISPTITPAIGPTNLSVSIFTLEEYKVNGVILTVSKYNIKMYQFQVNQITLFCYG